jgi:hypothetical protein
MVEFATAVPPEISILPIHFDVPGHYLSLETFTSTTAQTKAIIDGLNKEFYSGKLEYQLYILPPEEGSFKSKIGIAITVGGIIWAFAATDPGKGFIRGLTRHEPEYWAEQAGVYVREKIENLRSGDTAPVPPLPPDKMSKVESRILVETTKSFLQKDQSELNRIGVTPQKFYDAYEARNEFYQACLGSPDVRAIGFDETDRFPIKRKDFARLLVALGAREDEHQIVPWNVEIATLRVTSPNWDENDTQRPWKARDIKNKDRYFRIDDQQFWSFVHAKKIDPHIIDAIKVQWAFHRTGNQRRNFRVLRVLEYNDQALAEPLDDNALNAVLGSFDQDIGISDLFGM